MREALALGRKVVASDAARRPRGVSVYPRNAPQALADALARSFAAAAAPPPEDGLTPLLATYERLGLAVPFGKVATRQQ